jgi:hypothetical protein
MERYVCQLLDDIQSATENVTQPFIPPGGVDFRDVPTPEEEERTAPIRDLEEWTRIRKEQLPPAEMLSDAQVSRLLAALTTMLNVYNWSFVLQITVPERIQYETIRQHFDQPAKVKYWDNGFFEVCRPGTEHRKCTLGEYCQCAFYAELFAGFEDEDLSPEEERRRALDIEIQHLKRKYDDRWMRYYPYHLDPDYDDEDGNPYDYGMGEEEDEWE